MSKDTSSLEIALIKQAVHEELDSVRKESKEDLQGLHNRLSDLRESLGTKIELQANALNQHLISCEGVNQRLGTKIEENTTSLEGFKKGLWMLASGLGLLFLTVLGELLILYFQR